jgi:hypothetical protein
MYKIFCLFQPQFTHCMRPQADFQICCVVFSPLQNGKKYPKKTVCSYPNRAHITRIFSDFWWFSNKIWSSQRFFIAMTQLYSQMNVLFGISIKNCVESHIFRKKKFSIENSPVGDHSQACQIKILKIRDFSWKFRSL